MGLSLSARLEWVSQSDIRSMTIECDRIGGINLAQGVCDLEVPLPVRQGAHRAIDEGINTYTRFDGLKTLREAIARKHEASTGIAVDPENEVVAGSGTTGIFYCTVMAAQPGYESLCLRALLQPPVSTLRRRGSAVILSG